VGGVTATRPRTDAMAGEKADASYGSDRNAMRILRPQSAMPEQFGAAPLTGGAAPLLRCRVRLADGRLFSGELPPARHRALQLGLLHADTRELVELTPGTRPPNGKLSIDQRLCEEHYLPGGASGRRDWLEGLLEHAERIVAGAYTRRRFAGRPREEAFVGVAPRRCALGGKDAVEATRFLWVDVDKPGELPALWAFLAERPCHLLISSGGSGGVHAYWKLAEPLPATRLDLATGELEEPIERAHLQIIHRLGVGPDGRPTVADAQCRERARVMRLAGTINYKTGEYARVIDADLQLPAYPIGELIGDLPDPAPPSIPPRAGRLVPHTDPYKRIPPPEYFQRLTGITVPRGGLVSCPAPWHDDKHPSCSVGIDATQGWCCHSASCGARGAIYDLASVTVGGPWGRELRGDAFKRAHSRVADVFGEIT
jgi:hypothetical protein